jgi:hypothetical protein
MHVLVVTFSLRDLDDAAYRAHAEAIAPVFAGLPGLLSKTWLADAAANRYGGVYLFADRAALEAYLASDIVRGVRANPHFADLSVQAFEILEAASRLTRGAGVAAAAAVRSGELAGVAP